MLGCERVECDLQNIDAMATKRDDDQRYLLWIESVSSG